MSKDFSYLEEGRDFVICRLCQKKFVRITNTHLKKYHSTNTKAYKEKFPDAPIETDFLSSCRGSKLRGKNYEETFGIVEADELKKVHREKATNQWEKKKLGVESPHANAKGEAISKTKRAKSPRWSANNYRKLAFEYYPLICMRCGVEFPKKKLVVHHIDLKNFNSELGNHDIKNLMVLCRRCHSKLHQELRRVGTRFVGIPDIEHGMYYILKGLKNQLGLKLDDQHFVDTPRRVARAYVEIFEGVRDTAKQIKEILSTAFRSNMDQMIIVKDIHVFSMCPHHFLPVEYFISVAYIPNGYILGLSKLARLVEVLAKRPVVQEQLTEEITKYLMSIKASGAATRVRGQHFCMRMRGVKKPEAIMVTTSVLGNFREDQSTRSEFLNHIQDERSF